MWKCCECNKLIGSVFYYFTNCKHKFCDNCYTEQGHCLRCTSPPDTAPVEVVLKDHYSSESSDSESESEAEAESESHAETPAAPEKKPTEDKPVAKTPPSHS
jgi:hypothetical protein